MILFGFSQLPPTIWLWWKSWISVSEGSKEIKLIPLFFEISSKESSNGLAGSDNSLIFEI
jgi:hypothetical protein